MLVVTMDDVPDQEHEAAGEGDIAQLKTETISSMSWFHDSCDEKLRRWSVKSLFSPLTPILKD